MKWSCLQAATRALRPSCKHAGRRHCVWTAQSATRRAERKRAYRRSPQSQNREGDRVHVPGFDPGPRRRGHRIGLFFAAVHEPGYGRFLLQKSFCTRDQKNSPGSVIISHDPNRTSRLRHRLGKIPLTQRQISLCDRIRHSRRPSAACNDFYTSRFRAATSR